MRNGMSNGKTGTETDEANPIARDLATSLFSRLLRLEDRREPLVAQIASDVGIAIVEGRLRPGQDLNTVDLARQFGSSRTPVREALMLLEQEGLVVIRARLRPRVATLTPREISDIYDVRRELLALAGRLGVERATDEDIADMRQQLEVMRQHVQPRDPEGYLWTHWRFQDMLVELAGNSTLKRIHDTQTLRTLVVRRRALASAGTLERSFARQEHIVQAYQERDGELAALLLRRALHSLEEQLKRLDSELEGSIPTAGQAR